MEIFLWFSPVLAICALIFAAYKAGYVSKTSTGSSRMQ